MYLFVVIILVAFAICGVILGTQNSGTVVDIHLFTRELKNVPVTLLMVESFVAGIVLAFIVAIYDHVRLRARLRKKEREVETLTKEIGALRALPGEELKEL